MACELDHVFICTSVGAPEAERLVAVGLTEGTPNRHAGQGTACRRFFFANAFLELVWVENAEEAKGPVAGPLALWERWSGRGSGASPFGICLRPGPDGSPAPPFPAREYRPPYLPQPLVMYLALTSSAAAEPLLVYLPFGRRVDPASRPDPQPRGHTAGFRELTSVRIFSPHPPPDPAVVQAMGQTGTVAFRTRPNHLMEAAFDGEGQGRREGLAAGAASGTLLVTESPRRTTESPAGGNLCIPN